MSRSRIGLRLPRNSALVAALAAVVLLLVGLLVGRETAPAASPEAQPAASTSAAGGPAAPAAPSAADVGFAQDMAVHHEQAVLMADLALTRSTGPVRAIAESILTTQSQEVGLLRGWLRLWGAPAVDPTPMAWMGGTAMGHPMSTSASAASPASSANSRAGTTVMPGMASSPQLARLYRSRGRAFDVLFLQLMIRHHQGGLLMAHAALSGTMPAVHDAAQGITAEQVDDLGTMRALLQADGARQLPPPA